MSENKASDTSDATGHSDSPVRLSVVDGEVVLTTMDPTVVMSPEQAEEWCIALHEAAQQARKRSQRATE